MSDDDLAAGEADPTDSGGVSARRSGVSTHDRDLSPSMTDLMRPESKSGSRTSARAVARALAMFALWTVFGFLWSAPSFFGGKHGDDVAGFFEASDHVVPFYWAWAFLTPLVLALARRATPMRSGDTRGRLLLLVLAAPVAIVAHGVVYMLLLALLRVEPSLPITVARLVTYAWRHGGGDVAVYLTLVGVHTLVETTRRARERELVAAALEARLARADLELLRWQLQPHFLFNALNTVSTLVLKSETQGANRAIELIARYLRTALAQRPDATVSVAEELSVVRRYSEIEALRFGETLEVVVQVDDDALDARIPGSLLQPLVENAIRYGPVARGGAGPIVVTGGCSAGRLRLTISDPGTTARPTEPNGGDLSKDDGFGLRYVRERLRLFYGADASFDLSVSEAGTVAVLDLPMTVGS